MADKDFEKVTIEMGPCECPGSPHRAGDSAVAKVRFRFGDLRKIAWASQQPDFLMTAYSIVYGLVEWTLTDEDGDPRPITVTSIDDLSQEQGEALRKHFDTDEYADQIFKRTAGQAAQDDDLPNPPTGQSPDGSGEQSSSTSEPTPTSINELLTPSSV